MVVGHRAFVALIEQMDGMVDRATRQFQGEMTGDSAEADSRYRRNSALLL